MTRPVRRLRWLALPIAAAGLAGLAGLAASLLPAPPGGAPETVEATVLSIGDGDSLQVRREADGQRLTVRLACIDAPELAQSPDGERSRAYLRQRLPQGSRVALVPHDRDRYGRTVAEVIGEINIGLAMVEDGQAFVFPRYVDACDVREYRDAEYRASRHRYGVWRQSGGITRPWRFRREHRR